MRRPRVLPSMRVLPCLAVILLAGACSRPASPGTEALSDAVISLAVSGGFAGVAWDYTIDGPRATIRAGDCARGLGCDWEVGDTLGTFSPEEVRGLAGQFFERGFFGLERDDYGTQCCDQFHYHLTYVDPLREGHVSGSDGVLPAPAAELVAAVTAFVDRHRSRQP